MKILMIAPEPVFRPRGTPFSIRDRCRALSELGHEIDLLTYPFGDDFVIPNVTIHRIRTIPLINDIKIGFSWQKLPLDKLLFLKSILALRRTAYNVIHTHEEAGMMGAVLSRFFRIPHVYDMHSSLPQQFENYKTLDNAMTRGFMQWAERVILRNSDAVIAICPNLKDIALKSWPGAHVEVIENVAQESDRDPDIDEMKQIKAEYGLENKFIIGYTGTFEVNQGLDLLVEAFGIFHKQEPDAVLLLVGGEPRQIETIRQKCRDLNMEDACRFPGRQPVERMPSFMQVCDILVSPRSIGTNTPLKIYSYMKSGVPILATRLLTHTQVLDDATAHLVATDAGSLAEGITFLLKNPDYRKKIGCSARDRERDFYSYTAYKSKVKAIYDELEPKQVNSKSGESVKGNSSKK